MQTAFQKEIKLIRNGLITKMQIILDVLIYYKYILFLYKSIAYLNNTCCSTDYQRLKK